jgi:archaellum component FlaC
MVDKSDLILSAIERVHAKLTIIEADLNGLKADFAAKKVDDSELSVALNEMDTRIGLVAAHYQLVGRVEQISDQILRHFSCHA